MNPRAMDAVFPVRKSCKPIKALNESRLKGATEFRDIDLRERSDVEDIA